jgi:phage gpG-like protein
MPFRISITTQGAAGSGVRGRPLSAILTIPGLQGGREQSKIVQIIIRQWALGTLTQKVQESLAGGRLKRRTGNLAARTDVTVEPIGNSGSRVAIETRDIPYGSIHEFGGTVKAKSKEFLTIPLPAALTPAGVTKAPLTAFEPTFLRKPKSPSSKADWVVFLRNRDGTATPIFVLQREVQIPARKWASGALEDALPDLDRRIQTAFGG